ncbi:MAG: class I SAM-dependent methyltransferase [Dehalococcoidia bacterium]|nr:MAG: class I SAM-dependent methyltransferase [Dehalococcoidia bacterium]
MKMFKIEGIPGPGATFYSAVVVKSPIMKDFYHLVVAEVLSKLPSGRILDIGTGPGDIPLELAKSSKGLEIKAIDISPAMVDIARQNSRKMGLQGRVEFSFGSAEKIPFPNGYFDLVLSANSFHHWAEPQKCLKEIQRVLKNGGEAWIYDLRYDLTGEVKRATRKKYGWLMSSLFLYFVRLHSSLRAQDVQKILSSPGLGYSSTGLTDRGIILKQKLRK